SSIASRCRPELSDGGAARSPDPDAIGRRKVQRLSRLHREGVVPGSEISVVFTSSRSRRRRNHLYFFQTLLTVTGTPRKAAFPESASTACSSVRSLRLAPACARATERAAPSRACPQPWGRLTTPRTRSSVSATGTSIFPTLDSILARPPATTPRAAASSGWMESPPPAGPLA